MSDFPSIGHVAVTVNDLTGSRPWYQALIGAEPVLDEPTDSGFHHTVFAIGGTLLGLHQPPDADATTFSELHAGLDHIAFGCADRAALETWRDHLDQLDITHGGIVDAHYGSGLSFRDPTASPSSSSPHRREHLNRCQPPVTPSVRWQRVSRPDSNRCALASIVRFSPGCQQIWR